MHLFTCFLKDLRLPIASFLKFRTLMRDPNWVATMIPSQTDVFLIHVALHAVVDLFIRGHSHSQCLTKRTKVGLNTIDIGLQLCPFTVYLVDPTSIRLTSNFHLFLINIRMFSQDILHVSCNQRDGFVLTMRLLHAAKL